MITNEVVDMAVASFDEGPVSNCRLEGVEVDRNRTGELQIVKGECIPAPRALGKVIQGLENVVDHFGHVASPLDWIHRLILAYPRRAPDVKRVLHRPHDHLLVQNLENVVELAHMLGCGAHFLPDVLVQILVEAPGHEQLDALGDGGIVRCVGGEEEDEAQEHVADAEEASDRNHHVSEVAIDVVRGDG